MERKISECDYTSCVPLSPSIGDRWGWHIPRFSALASLVAACLHDLRPASVDSCLPLPPPLVSVRVELVGVVNPTCSLLSDTWCFEVKANHLGVSGGEFVGGVCVMSISDCVLELVRGLSSVRPRSNHNCCPTIQRRIGAIR